MIGDLDRADVVTAVAADFVRWYGRRVLEHLLEAEATARDDGDHGSADAWFEILQSAAGQIAAADAALDIASRRCAPACRRLEEPRKEKGRRRD